MSSLSMAARNSAADSWDQPTTTAFPSSSRRTVTTQAIPDDWDAEDVEEGEQDAQQLWDAANRKAPMPELVISSSSTTTVVSPPPAAFQPTLRILKRPSSAQPSKSPSPSAADSKKTLAEREAEYQAARERIFKESATSPSSIGTSRANPAIASVKIIRDPKGPESDPQPTTSDGAQSKGFGRRRAKSPPSQVQPQPHIGSGTFTA